MEIRALCVRALPACAFLAAAVPAARADVVIETTEMLAQIQGSDTVFMGRYFGSDPSSPILFNAQADFANRTITYSTVPGSTYLGQPLSLSNVAAYNAGADQWEWTSQGQLGAQSWTNTGNGQYIGDPTIIVAGFVPIGGIIYDYHAIVTVTFATFFPPSGTSSGTASLTLNAAVVGTAPISDTFNGTAFTWKFGNITFNNAPLGVEMRGSLSPDGAGQFTVLIPTPGALALLGLGGLVAGRRRRNG